MEGITRWTGHSVRPCERISRCGSIPLPSAAPRNWQFYLEQLHYTNLEPRIKVRDATTRLSGIQEAI